MDLNIESQPEVARPNVQEAGVYDLVRLFVCLWD